MCHKVQATDQESFGDLQRRLFDIWDEEPVSVSEQGKYFILREDLPTALLGELLESGYTVTMVLRNP